MLNTSPKNYLDDKNPLDIINYNIEKLNALNTLLTDDDISVKLTDISSGLYFLLTDIQDQLKYASQSIETRQHAEIAHRP